MKDLHIHIERGPYTVEWIERFIEKAAAENLDEICLLEHSIRFKEFHPTFKEAREYNLYQQKWFEGKKKSAHSLDEFKILADKIRAKSYPIKVSFGLEICYFEQHQDKIRELVSDGFFDYLLGSVHWVDNWTFNQRKYQWLGKDFNHIYKRYFELQNSLVESEIFDIIAHPDLITCHGLYPDYNLEDTYKKLCENIKSHNMMLEMNTSKGLGINKQFFDTAKNIGVTFSTGSDAHRVEDVGRKIKEVTELICRKYN
ncbi:MAG: PHP domain-containing protein [Acetobacter sp.]|nr:PHP domain-containing protein [Bacteroides sp.]MCM1340465.1 PHP domain-containing protein [Acetobacter sp.]MCM1433205.1 PHP domain-containing protein [Clostridiales bacterium]